MAGMAAALDDFGAASLWSLNVAELADAVVTMERMSRRLAAAQLRMLAQADSSGVAAQTGASSTAVWLRAVADIPVGVGKARLALHRELVNRGATARALSAGDINLDHASAVVAAINALPAETPSALTDEIEGLLVDTAREEGTRAVLNRSAQIFHRYAPDVLEERERRQREDRFLTLIQRPGGTLGIRGSLDKEAGALVLAVLGSLAAPSPAVDGTPDLRSGGQRYADALTQLCQLSTPSLPSVRGERPHVLLTISYETLRGELAENPPYLETGTPISVGAARRILCDANVIPVVLGSDSQPLDVGRATREVPVGLRRALIARDGGCTFPACDRPPSWCDSHHIIYWSAGGITALCNLCLLCSQHHDAVHHDGWEITMIGQRPWFLPPAWIDSPRTPRLHSRYKLRELRC